MSDIEVFKKVMNWMQMEVLKEKTLDNGHIVLKFQDTKNDSDVFTKIGYDEFYAGIIFDEEGNLIKGYIDSHVAYASKNCEIIDEILKD